MTEQEQERRNITDISKQGTRKRQIDCNKGNSSQAGADDVEKAGSTTGFFIVDVGADVAVWDDGGEEWQAVVRTTLNELTAP